MVPHPSRRFMRIKKSLLTDEEIDAIPDFGTGTARDYSGAQAQLDKILRTLE